MKYRFNSYRNSLLTLILVLTGSSPLMAASFDCRKAASDVEKAICNDKEVSNLDSEMAKAYKALLNALSKAEAAILKKDQGEWLNERESAYDSCDRDEPEACLEYEYAVRLAILGTPKPAGFDCKKARSPAEKKICASPLLSHADGQMAEIYKPLREDFKKDQRDWLAMRDKELADPACDTLCAWKFYGNRIRFFVHQNF